MMWPTVEEDRLAALGELLHSKAQPAWRRHSIPLTITFFVLTCIAVAAFAAFLDLIRAPYGVATLAVCIGIAELLIQGYNFQRTGVESALWIAGPVVFIISLPNQGKPEAALVTLRVQGRIGEGISCKIETGKGIVQAGLHPATGATASAYVPGTCCWRRSRHVPASR